MTTPPEPGSAEIFESVALASGHSQETADLAAECAYAGLPDYQYRVGGYIGGLALHLLTSVPDGPDLSNGFTLLAAARASFLAAVPVPPEE